MKKILYTTILITLCQILLGQERIDVSEQTIKIGSKEEAVLYYGFAAGDQIVFNFEEIDGKEVKEIEIIEMPENSKYQDYEVKSVRDKVLKTNKKGIYKFRFYNAAAMKGRVCRIKIQRIPKNDETINFDTRIKWIEKFDTTYDIRTETVLIRYDTIIKQKSRRVLASIDTNIVQAIDRVERVHSITNGNGNVSLITFQLPENTYSPNIFTPYSATETISWAYVIAVGDGRQAWFKNADTKAAARATSKLAVKTGLISSGYGALALLAIEGLSAFSSPPQGDNIQFRFYEGQSATMIYGNSVVASGRVIERTQGFYTLRLENDNAIDGINVDIKIVAVTITKKWKDENYTIQDIEPVKEKRTLKIPKVSKIKVPVLIED